MSRAPVLPLIAVATGIALFAGMDAAMKGLSLGIGVYNAMFWRCLVGAALAFLPWVALRTRRPTSAAMRIHMLRGAIVAVMALCFFYGITRVPLAEGIALTFIAPLIALYLAAILLGETVERRSVDASLIGLAGVGVILWARAGATGEARALDGVAALLASAVLYAYNLILARQQAQIASPAEVAFVQQLAVSAYLALASPWLAVLPGRAHWPLLVLAAGLAVISLFVISWAYARAEAQLLLPVEYSAFIWAAMLGAVFFHEALTPATVVGAGLIVAGCLYNARRAPMQAVEA